MGLGGDGDHGGGAGSGGVSGGGDSGAARGKRGAEAGPASGVRLRHHLRLNSLRSVREYPLSSVSITDVQRG